MVRRYFRSPPADSGGIKVQKHSDSSQQTNKKKSLKLFHPASYSYANKLIFIS